MCLLHLLGLEWQTILFHDCGAASLFCAKGLWLWLVQSQDSSHICSPGSVCPRELLVGICSLGSWEEVDSRVWEPEEKGQQGLRTWRGVSQGLGRAAVQQLAIKPGRFRAAAFNSALLCSVVAVISFPSCANADLSVTDRDYVLSPTGNSESLGGLFCLCPGSFLSPWAGPFLSTLWAALSPSLRAQACPQGSPFACSAFLCCAHSALCSCSACSHISAFFHLCHRCRDSELCLWCFVAGIIHLPGVLCCACLPAAPQFTGTCVVTAGTSSACSELAAGQCLGLALPTSLRHRECPGVTKPHGDFRAFGVSTCSEATWHHLWLTVPICSSYRAAVKILKKAGY